MNANQKSELTLDDVLHRILLAANSNGDFYNRAELQLWTNRFPEFRREIAEFFVQETLLENLPEPNAITAEESQFAGRSQKLLEQILNRQQTAAQSAASREIESIENLQAAAAKQNLNIPQFAQKIGLSRQLLLSLEQRLVKPATISRKLKTRLADALQTSIESIENYFAQPAAFLPGASYKSGEQPSLGEQQDFAELVKKDLRLTADEKQALLD